MLSAHPRLTPYQVKSVLRSVAANVNVTITDEPCGFGLFHGLGEADIAALAEVCFVRRLARGQVLFRAGEEEHLSNLRPAQCQVS